MNTKAKVLRRDFILWLIDKKEKKEEKVYLTDEVLNNFDYDNINNHLKYDKKVILERNLIDANKVTLCPLNDIGNQEQEQEQEQEQFGELTRIQKLHNEYESDEDVKTEITTDDPESNNFLYPELDDNNFNKELMKHKEFNSLKQNIQETNKSNTLKELQDEMCSNEFELSPHQLFVKNFLSHHTPYNGLLLYHGLGTGKTCSAIGIAEEMRSYIKQIGFGSNNIKKIIIIASPNVQDNFKTQLFDESKLKQVDGMWRIEGCIGNALLNEINPSEINDMSRIKIIDNIKRIINKYYVFYGYYKIWKYRKGRN